MIESRYYRKDLKKLVKKLTIKKNPKKWSEKRMVVMEKRIVLCFYIIRKLIENDKVTNKTKSHVLTIEKFPRTLKAITPINYWVIDEIYELDNGSIENINIKDFSDLCIHSRIIYLQIDDTDNWDKLYLTSDKKMDEFLLSVSVEELIRTLNIVIKDYPKSINYTWNPSKSDFDKEIN